MACGSCAVDKNGKVGGCSGGCSGGCNRLNTFDWLTALEIEDTAAAEAGFDLVEISFKNGARKDFFHNPSHTRTTTGDRVLVEVAGGSGYDVGTISLSGELVRLQIKKKNVKERSIALNVIRRANERDLEKLNDARAHEKKSLIRARAIARTIDLDMKIGDVEYQGDGRKATFFYTADGRVDFRELIRHYAKEFRVKIEMRQIGARQESARVGGLGSCGRELCCSTWLSDFKTVSTAAARYQQLAINQSKLSGACGRLKCCLNFELDTYLDSLDKFPDHNEKLFVKVGKAFLVKTDVFRGLMTYSMETGEEKGQYYTLGIREVKTVLERLSKGEEVYSLKEFQVQQVDTKRRNSRDDEDDDIYDEPDVDYEDVTGAVELKDDKRRKRKRGGKKQREKSPRSTESTPSASAEKNPRERNDRRERNERNDRDKSTNNQSRDNRENRENRDNRDKNRQPQKPQKPLPPVSGDEPINEALMFGGEPPRDREKSNKNRNRDNRENRDNRDNRDNRENRENRDNRDKNRQPQKPQTPPPPVSGDEPINEALMFGGESGGNANKKKSKFKKKPRNNNNGEPKNPNKTD